MFLLFFSMVALMAKVTWNSVAPAMTAILKLALYYAHHLQLHSTSNAPVSYSNSLVGPSMKWKPMHICANYFPRVGLHFMLDPVSPWEYIAGLLKQIKPYADGGTGRVQWFRVQILLWIPNEFVSSGLKSTYLGCVRLTVLLLVTEITC